MDAARKNRLAYPAPGAMIGKIILGLVILLVLYVVWSIWHACRRGHAKGFFGNIFAHACHLFSG